MIGRILVLSLLSLSQGKEGRKEGMNLYLSTDQTEALYGIKTKGIYYVRDGMVNDYAISFQHQAIPADVDHVDFTWRTGRNTAVPYKMTFIHTPGPAMDPPTVNISMAGLVPSYTDKFRLHFPCTGKVSAEVDTLLQVQHKYLLLYKVGSLNFTSHEGLVLDINTKCIIHFGTQVHVRHRMFTIILTFHCLLNLTLIPY